MAELDAIHPASDDERTAADIARVENIDVFGDATRILPALLESERLLPESWNASLRVAQMESKAKQYDASIAACNRGLTRSPGPLGRAWLLEVKADGLRTEKRVAEVRLTLAQALEAAQDIPFGRTRDSNLTKIKNAMASLPR